MRCEEFLNQWETDGWRRFLIRPFLLPHWMGCRECRETLRFKKRLACSLKTGEEWEETFSRKLRQRLTEEGIKRGIITPGPGGAPVPRRWAGLLLPLGGAVVVLLLVVVLVRSMVPGKPSIKGDYLLSSPGGMAVFSQLGDEDLHRLEEGLDEAFDLSPSWAAVLSVTPWTDVVEEASARPGCLEEIFPAERGEWPEQKGKEV